MPCARARRGSMTHRAGRALGSSCAHTLSRWVEVGLLVRGFVQQGVRRVSRSKRVASDVLVTPPRTVQCLPKWGAWRDPHPILTLAPVVVSSSSKCGAWVPSTQLRWTAQCGRAKGRRSSRGATTCVDVACPCAAISSPRLSQAPGPLPLQEARDAAGSRGAAPPRPRNPTLGGRDLAHGVLRALRK